MMTSATKSKTAFGDGFFNKFERVMAGEAVNDPVRTRRREGLKAKKKNLTSSGMIPPGQSFGTFSGKMEAFSPKTAGVKAKVEKLPNIKTNPGKKGTGYGYGNVTLNKLPEYKSSPYDAAEAQARKVRAAGAKKQVGGAFRANAPDNCEPIDRRPYKPGPVREGSVRDKKPERKPAVPFYPQKGSMTMASGQHKFGTFDKFVYVGDKAKRAAGGGRRKNKFGEWKPSNGAKSTRVVSVSGLNIGRSLHRGNRTGM